MFSPRVSPISRHLLDSGLALGTLSLAVLIGYLLLAPEQPRATPVPSAQSWVDGQRPPPVPLVLPEPWPEPARGVVLDADHGLPIAGATVSVGRYEAMTDAHGRFTLDSFSPDAKPLVKAPGYKPRRMPIRAGWSTVTLKPHAIKAAYLSYYGISDRGTRERVFELLDRTELNAVVIDVKGDRGFIPYLTRVPLAVEAGARGPVRVQNFEQLLAGLKTRGIYTIGRIVVFKDDLLARYRPEWAILDARTAEPWIDDEELAWVDPFREEVWEYVIAVAREAALKGFNEIQFDYLRFPTDGKLSAARYSRPNTQKARLEAISTFLARVRRELAPLGVFLAADVFGYIAFNADDTQIGQRVEELARHLDYLSPMVYPSSYHRGVPGYPNPVEHPYEVVRATIRLMLKRAAHAPVQVRPWLQDFRDYAFDRRPFGVKELRAQIKGAEDAGSQGWMLWNPRNRYTVEALRREAQLADPEPWSEP
ncbi:MAG: putative glycoside hydrolase [Candidatus Methylomirabilia bacterium]